MAGRGLDTLQLGVKHGKVRLEFESITEKERNVILSRERCIGKAELADDDESVVLQGALEDATDASDLIDRAANSAVEPPEVVEDEVHVQHEVRALPGYLVVQPPLRFIVRFRAGGEADVELLVVGFD